ncbi:hypothetical protein LCGC14_2787870 [marine sediment metagenome]|uniref:Uncharacterized protein n=1 Tax=marine sediment metagenome TaxID=412755 RepID=A0A0F9BHX9_9ZZZZ
MRIEATILIEPVAKARARHTVIGKHVRTYTPAKTANAETLVLYSVREKLASGDTFPKGVALHLAVTFYRAKPKSAPKRLSMPLTRPDLDNYLKLLLDALNGYAFPDDGQVTRISAAKRFGDPPRIELVLTEDNPESDFVRTKENGRLL